MGTYVLTSELFKASVMYLRTSYKVGLQKCLALQERQLHGVRKKDFYSDHAVVLIFSC